jgi:pimeloyl-ACP methyl ester carboxylesterase
MDLSGRVQTSDGRDLQFSQWGPPDGRPVFVLHGTPGSRYLRHVQGEYERQSVRAITYDRPGYGGSSRLPGRNVAQSAADLATIADHLGLQQFAVVGISGGGPSALAAAAAMPERITRCATIVGAGPHDAEDLDVYAGMSDEELEEWACVRQGEAWLDGTFYQESLDWVESLARDENLREPVRSMLVDAFREALLTPYGMADDYASMLAPWGFDMSAVTCATKVMIAQEDTSVPPSHGDWLVAHLPNAAPVLVDGGHFGPRDEPEEQLLSWLVAEESSPGT